MTAHLHWWLKLNFTREGVSSGKQKLGNCNNKCHHNCNVVTQLYRKEN